ncbi:hypothetical protein NHX12_032385 [Muraenolepis orangiensis]|uniref:Uncharacterized protein n=1 Tax=Muraenolepis orangiensis TaxID=630683 RepID=A0A9Q0E5L3_9TELE|nr:hypothetical protein NHX12_032385 [Muraenolepis orangiensis]
MHLYDPAYSTMMKDRSEALSRDHGRTAAEKPLCSDSFPHHPNPLCQRGIDLSLINGPVHLCPGGRGWLEDADPTFVLWIPPKNINHVRF